MQRILVVSENVRSGESIKRVIEKLLPFPVTCVYDLQGAKTQMEMKSYNLVILDHRIVDDHAMTRVDWLKHSSWTFPLLIYTEKVLPHLVQRLTQVSDLHELARPTSEKNLAALAKKLVQSRAVLKQQFRRYNTNQTAAIVNISRGLQLEASMYNLSKGGAYCEFTDAQMMAVGEKLNFKVFLDDSKKEYTFKAQVIWTTPKGRFTGRAGCGLKFLIKEN